LSQEPVWRWRSRENIEGVGESLHLPARELLGSAQSVLGTITFNRDPRKVGR
jgi:hypothetical protein